MFRSWDEWRSTGAVLCVITKSVIYHTGCVHGCQRIIIIAKGADSTGATGAFTHEGTGAKITFCPSNFQRVCNGFSLDTFGHYYIDCIDCAPTRLFGLSVTPSVHRSIRLESFVAAFTSTLGGVFNRIFTFYHVLKGNVKPCSPSRPNPLTVFDLRL